ncbi:hypothetical protein [Paenibacillus rigui]|uniref:hypothetical protein n=1 Tax=Paenibacillus rigui TaxID=554312 RepID=UPI0011802AA1|nr:hypothetical protein [Paenibacillus rigui]
MSKRKAIGHVCGKIAQVMYSCLKNNRMYDPVLHAKHLGVPWDGKLDIRMPKNVDELESKAAEFSEENV